MATAEVVLRCWNCTFLVGFMSYEGYLKVSSILKRNTVPQITSAQHFFL